MKKQVWVLLGILAVVLSVTAWVVLNNPKDEKEVYPDRDFATENIDEVHRIFLADKKGKTIDLQREGERWIVNGKHEAFFNTMDVLLRSLKRLRVKYIPPKAAEEHIIKNLAANGIKVELYDASNEVIKVFYVGSNTSDDLGTAFIMEGYSQPYILNVAGHHGGIRTRFDLDEDDLIDRWIFSEKFDEIKKVSLEYPSQRNKSFILKNQDGKFELSPFYEITPRIQGEILPAAVEAFLTGFEKLGAEAVINDSPSKDSVLSQIPFVKINVELSDGTEKSVDLYPVFDQIGEDARKVGNVQYETFVERYFAMSGSGNFYMTQHQIFGRILWAYEHFYDPQQSQMDLLN